MGFSALWVFLGFDFFFFFFSLLCLFFGAVKSSLET